MDNMKEKQKAANPNVLMKCLICSKSFKEEVLDKHMQSLSHHKKIEQIRGSEQLHQCWACAMSVVGLQMYKQHIGTHQHRDNMLKLQQKRHQKQILAVDYKTELDVNHFNLINQKECSSRCPAQVELLKQDKKRNMQKCFVCCQSFPPQDLDKHMHSFVHHLAIERLKSSKLMHKCWACDQSVMGIQEFKKHISTKNHKYMMLTRMKNKSQIDYSADFDDELKALCAQRDHQMYLSKKKRLLKKKEAKKAVAQHKVQQAPQPKSQIINKSSSLQTGQDFTSDELPSSCDFLKPLDEQKNILSSKANQTEPKRKQIIFDGPPVKRFCPSSAVSPQDMSVYEYKPTHDGNVATESKSENKPGSSTCPEQVQRADSHVSTMIQAIRRSVEYRGVVVGSDSEEKMQRCTREVVAQTYKSNHIESNKTAKKRKRSRKKKNAVKINASNLNDSQKSGQECYNDVMSMRRSNGQEHIYATSKVELHQGHSSHMTRSMTSRREASLSSVTSLAEIKRLQTLATHNDNVYREDINGYNTVQAETSREDLHRFQTITSNLPNPLRRKRDISSTAPQNPCTTTTQIQAETSREDLHHFKTITYNLQSPVRRKLNPNTTTSQNSVNKLMTLSSREEELTVSLRNVSDQLFQAFSTLQNAYNEVQHLLEIKQQVSSEMASLRAKRIQFLQDMI